MSWFNACDKAAARYTVTAGVQYTQQHLHVPEWSPISSTVHCTVCGILVQYYCVAEECMNGDPSWSMCNRPAGAVVNLSVCWWQQDALQECCWSVLCSCPEW